MSADTRILVIKKESGGAFAGVVQGAEVFVDSDPSVRLQAATFEIDRALPALPEEPTLGLVAFSTFEEALDAMPRIEEWWTATYLLEYEPMVLTLSGGDLREMRKVVTYLES